MLGLGFTYCSKLQRLIYFILRGNLKYVFNPYFGLDTLLGNIANYRQTLRNKSQRANNINTCFLPQQERTSILYQKAARATVSTLSNVC